MFATDEALSIFLYSERIMRASFCFAVFVKCIMLNRKIKGLCIEY